MNSARQCDLGRKELFTHIGPGVLFLFFTPFFSSPFRWFSNSNSIVFSYGPFVSIFLVPNRDLCRDIGALDLSRSIGARSLCTFFSVQQGAWVAEPGVGCFGYLHLLIHLPRCLFIPSS
jgi:hypothetical protein